MGRIRAIMQIIDYVLRRPEDILEMMKGGG